MTYFDTHAHFYGEASPAENALIVKRACEVGVTQLVAVGGSPDLNSGAIGVATAFPANIRLALGFDRDQAKAADPETLVQTLRLLAQDRVIAAVGEIGLDFHYHPETVPAQEALFAAQLRVADEWQKPVIIHTREADEATLRILDETPWQGKGLRGVVHCFTGDKHFASQLLDRQLAISFSGIVTFRNAEMLRESAAFVPDDRLLIETDSPFLAPVPLRGKRNEPAFVTHVAACLAAVRKTDEAAIAGLTFRNAESLFASNARF
jgi:TatD DNase family protein